MGMARDDQEREIEAFEKSWIEGRVLEGGRLTLSLISSIKLLLTYIHIYRYFYFHLYHVHIYLYFLTVMGLLRLESFFGVQRRILERGEEKVEGYRT